MANGQIDILVAKKAIKELDTGIAKIDKMNMSILELSKSVRTLNTDLTNVKTPKGLETRLKKNADAQNKVKESVEKVRLAEIKLAQQREKAFDKFNADITKTNKARVKESEAIERNKAALLKQKKATLEASGAYRRLNREYEKSKTNLANLLSAENKNTAAIKKAQREFDRLGAKVRKVDAATRNYTKGIGNYGSALRGTRGLVRQLTSAMGLMGGAFLAVSIIRNTAKRIRDFDKSIVGLSAILKTNRKDLKNLEQTIIDVAGASIKTSNEVADLATKLATLGKSKQEIIDLLEPVNNLSIGLEATSEEAGELLIQTLNAFGKGSEEASKFADIIAKMRTSTALDFERIKDALGFLAPTARAAGVSFEETGAILGVLVDNGIKASRAGRLMSSSFIRLAQSGKTLQEALSEVRIAQQKGVDSVELLQIAGDLFGTRSAALGLILADNTQKTADLTKEFENAGGSLKELTDKQLESLDAKFKILDATWEKFIVNIENGEGALADFTKSAITSITDLIGAIDDVSTVSEESGSFVGNFFRSFFSTDTEKAFKVQAELIREQKKHNNLLEEAINIAIKQNGVELTRLEILTIGAELSKLTTEELEAYIKALTKKNKVNKENIEIEEEANEVMKGSIDWLNEMISANNKLINQSNDRGTIEKLQEENKLLEIQKQLLLQGERARVEVIKTSGVGIVGSQSDGDINTGGLQQDQVQSSEFDLLIDEISSFVDVYGSQIDAAIDITNSFFDNRINRIDEDIAKNNEFFDKQIEAAIGNKELQEQLEFDKQAKNKILEAKKREEQKKQFKLNKAIAIADIAINTAIAISKSLAITPLPAGLPFVIANAALGALQIGAVLARQLPAFKDGTKSPLDKDTLAVTGDGGKREPITKNGELIGLSPSVPTLTYLPKGAEVHKDIDSFASKGYDIDAINKAAVMTSIHNDGKMLNTIKVINDFNMNLDGYQRKIESGIKNGFKRYAKTNISNTINIEDSNYNKEL